MSTPSSATPIPALTRLPQLRQELTLTRGIPSPEGAPTWMLHDPAANRFFQLGWPAFELLSRSMSPKPLLPR